VIVPVYAAAEFIDDCVSSLLTQTYRHLDIILIDDGSPDASLTICQAWAARDPRVTVVAASHGGASVARNHGLAAAEGEFVTFVDADDVVDREHVAHLLEIALSTGADLVTSNLAQFAGDERPIYRAPESVDTVPSGDALARIVTSGVGFASCGKLVRRRSLEGLQYTPGTLFEDLEFLPRMFSRVSRVAISDGVTYGYRRYSASTEGGHEQLLKVALLDVLASNISFAAGRPGQNSDVVDLLVVGYCLHATRILEGASVSGATRERGFDRQYRRFMLSNLRAIGKSDGIAASYKLAIALSIASPGLFVEVFRLARLAKSTIAPNLRRASTPRRG
jgi:glycosyltransferase involved in cell wall biosynthesis